MPSTSIFVSFPRPIKLQPLTADFLVLEALAAALAAFCAGVKG